MSNCSSPSETSAASKDKRSLSPKYSRLHEKEDLANLNNRLACYIDRVRTLENENYRLTQDMKLSQENVAREVTSVKSLYESELSEARKLLDEVSREKAKIQIDTQRLFTENNELLIAMSNKDSEINNLRLELSELEQSLTDISNKFSALQTEKKKLFEVNRNLTAEKKKLTDELVQARHDLDEEVLQRVNAENSLQTLREEFCFTENLLKQQLIDAQKTVEAERSEIDGKLNQVYEERLCRSLQEIRDQYEADLEENKDVLKKLYEDKLKNLESQSARNSNMASMAMDELKNMQGKIEKLNRRNNELESERNMLLKNLRETEVKLDDVKADYMKQFNLSEAETKLLREEITRRNEAYEELMDVKVALDVEISAFRKLLECEEQRLNITPISSPLDNSSRRILKGKRRHEEPDDVASNYSLNASSGNSIVIAEVSSEGYFIKIYNNSDMIKSIGLWQLIQKVGDSSRVHTFGRNIKVKPGSSVTVWSNNAPKIPGGPKNIVMKDMSWDPADQMSISLLNQDNEPVATAELSKVTSTSTRHQRGKRLTMSDSFSASNISTAEEKCSIM